MCVGPGGNSLALYFKTPIVLPFYFLFFSKGENVVWRYSLELVQLLWLSLSDAHWRTRGNRVKNHATFKVRTEPSMTCRLVFHGEMGLSMICNGVVVSGDHSEENQWTPPQAPALMAVDGSGCYWWLVGSRHRSSFRCRCCARFLAKIKTPAHIDGSHPARHCVSRCRRWLSPSSASHRTTHYPHVSLKGPAPNDGMHHHLAAWWA